jgi:predicted transcriptional regulator
LDSPTLIHGLRSLETNGFVCQDEARAYGLTAIGRVVTRKAADFFSATEVLLRHEAFWAEHDVSGIPDALFDRIGALRDSTLVGGCEFDPFDAYRRFVTILKTSSTLELISSVSAPDPCFLFDELCGKHIESVLTEPVFRHAREELGDARVKKALNEGHKLYVARYDPKLVFAVTDDATVLLLCRLNGAFDFATALTSRSPQALEWGHEMFRRYVAVSERVAL